MSPTPHDDAPVHRGDMLAGKYRVEQVLGIGGMGVVVAATQVELQRLVALKFVLPNKAKDVEAVERFLREARAAVRLRSEHVARVLDVGKLESGAPYMVMEFLEGSDLDSVLRAGPLEPEIACDYIVQACEALAEAHAIGLVHRDLKPHNLFLAKGVGGASVIKVLDFGISKMLHREHAISRDLTRTTSVLGSPFYMPPEQMRSARKVDARSDIWSLGVILYELLTTHVPWEAESITELAVMVTHEPPTPIEEYRADVPEGIRKVIERCLQKDPAGRYADAGELATDLAPFASTRAGQTAERARNASRVTPISVRTPEEQLPSLLEPERRATSTHATWGDGAPQKRDGAKTWTWAAIAVVVAAGAAIGILSTRGATTTTATPMAVTTTPPSETIATTATPIPTPTPTPTQVPSMDPTPIKKLGPKLAPKPAASASISTTPPKPSAAPSASKSTPDDDIPTIR